MKALFAAAKRNISSTAWLYRRRVARGVLRRILFTPAGASAYALQPAAPYSRLRLRAATLAAVRLVATRHFQLAGGSGWQYLMRSHIRYLYGGKASSVAAMTLVALAAQSLSWQKRHIRRDEYRRRHSSDGFSVRTLLPARASLCSRIGGRAVEHYNVKMRRRRMTVYGGRKLKNNNVKRGRITHQRGVMAAAIFIGDAR